MLSNDLATLNGILKKKVASLFLFIYSSLCLCLLSLSLSLSYSLNRTGQGRGQPHQGGALICGFCHRNDNLSLHITEYTMLGTTVMCHNL